MSRSAPAACLAALLVSLSSRVSERMTSLREVPFSMKSPGRSTLQSTDGARVVRGAVRGARCAVRGARCVQCVRCVRCVRCVVRAVRCAVGVEQACRVGRLHEALWRGRGGGLGGAGVRGR